MLSYFFFLKKNHPSVSKTRRAESASPVNYGLSASFGHHGHWIITYFSFQDNFNPFFALSPSIVAHNFKASILYFFIFFTYNPTTCLSEPTAPQWWLEKTQLMLFCRCTNVSWMRSLQEGKITNFDIIVFAHRCSESGSIARRPHPPSSTSARSTRHGLETLEIHHLILTVGGIWSSTLEQRVGKKTILPTRLDRSTRLNLLLPYLIWSRRMEWRSPHRVLSSFQRQWWRQLFGINRSCWSKLTCWKVRGTSYIHCFKGVERRIRCRFQKNLRNENEKSLKIYSDLNRGKRRLLLLNHRENAPLVDWNFLSPICYLHQGPSMWVTLEGYVQYTGNIPNKTRTLVSIVLVYASSKYFSL